MDLLDSVHVILLSLLNRFAMPGCQTMAVVSVEYIFNPILVIPIAAIGAIAAILGTSVCIIAMCHHIKKKSERISDSPHASDHDDDGFTPVVIIDAGSVQ